MKKQPLALRKQTLVQLSASRLAQVQGGYTLYTGSMTSGSDPLSDSCPTGLTTMTTLPTHNMWE
jgi:hypothetical protein